MKYSIELTDSGKVRERFEFDDEKFGKQIFECSHQRTGSGSIALDEPIGEQMQNAGIVCEEIAERYSEIFDDCFISLDFFHLAELFNEYS